MSAQQPHTSGFPVSESNSTIPNHQYNSPANIAARTYENWYYYLDVHRYFSGEWERDESIVRESPPPSQVRTYAPIHMTDVCRFTPYEHKFIVRVLAYVRGLGIELKSSDNFFEVLYAAFSPHWAIMANRPASSWAGYVNSVRGYDEMLAEVENCLIEDVDGSLRTAAERDAGVDMAKVFRRTPGLTGDVDLSGFASSVEGTPLP
ncbi:uncharacterized protein CcaverHIS019_0101800 [Cutaneotrichosporon cavernicola]|uniref:Uncharacterized protein n=1 Tax=Cutaneotrichosporon cavernicola TaxID=279322 RepID=A0AA48I123_9TREE|nr:uncharacterized protein CcaverHIS019_0101800 [Cutaneotrichosporon cavernicola]BEI87462.1 hypothetical protein CcaverHIS019_0101800 [Cutaneotrichosporon cavernicola]BEI95232.1 hypothetical protein CcaverHIS631_0101810 [Cutaneotrichosporon cavernicola]